MELSWFRECLRLCPWEANSSRENDARFQRDPNGLGWIRLRTVKPCPKLELIQNTGAVSNQWHLISSIPGAIPAFSPSMLPSVILLKTFLAWPGPGLIQQLRAGPVVAPRWFIQVPHGGSAKIVVCLDDFLQMLMGPVSDKLISCRADLHGSFIGEALQLPHKVLWQKDIWSTILSTRSKLYSTYTYIHRIPMHLDNIYVIQQIAT